MKSVAAGVVAAVLVSLVACDRPDARPGVHLVSTSPANGATRVGVHDRIVLTFSGPLDPDSINANTVKFRRPGEGDARAPNLAYDPSTHTITVTPREPMQWGDQQIVALGLEDPYGDSVLRTKVSFRTFRNPATDAVDYGTDGVRWWRFENDEEGRPVRELALYQGADWYWRHSTYGEHGRLTRSVTYVPGGDGLSGTPDDAVSSYEEYEYDDVGNPTRYTAYSGAGQVIEYGTTAYDQLGNATHGTAAQGSAEGYWWLATHDVFGNETGYYEATTPGFDGTLGNADDVSRSAWKTEWDERGTLLAHTRLSSPGPDGLWLTPDDVTAERYAYTYDASGNPIRYDAGTWCQELLYDQAGHMTHDLVSGAGTDGRCFTGDETGLFKSGFEYAYDGLGRRTRAVEYLLGVTTRYTSTSYAGNGNRTGSVTYDGPGSNGTWFDVDDQVSYEYLYDATK